MKRIAMETTDMDSEKKTCGEDEDSTAADSSTRSSNGGSQTTKPG